MKFHLHIGNKRVLTCDLAPKQRAGINDATPDLEQFIKALLEAVARADGRTTDEEEGHEFHGNQYVTVAGAGQGEEEPKPKPTAATPGKGVKSATHELLS